MSVHRSLYKDKFKHKKKSVLSRVERVRVLLDKGKKIEDIDLYHLPKTKIIKIKVIKDEKKKEAVDLVALAMNKAKQPK